MYVDAYMHIYCIYICIYVCVCVCVHMYTYNNNNGEEAMDLKRSIYVHESSWQEETELWN